MKVSAIITSDIHLRDTQPECRTDNYFEAQTKKIHWLKELQKEHQCPILDAGDLFHKWNSSNFLTAWAIKNLPSGMITTVGNHEMPSHNMNYFNKSSLHVLQASGKIFVIPAKEVLAMPEFLVYSFPYGSEIKDPGREEVPDIRRVALIHAPVSKEKAMFDTLNGRDILNKLKSFDLVITGHHHQSFSIYDKERILLNPGSLMRMTADQIDFEPCVYLYYAEDNSLEAIPVPIEKGVIDRGYIDIANKKEERVNSFVERMSEDYEIDLSFEKNLESYFAANKVRAGIKDVIYKSLEA